MAYMIIYVVGQGYGQMSDKEFDRLPEGAKLRVSVVRSGIRSERVATKLVKEERQKSGIEWKRDTTYYTRDGKHMETGQQRRARAEKKLLKGFRRVRRKEVEAGDKWYPAAKTRASNGARVQTRGNQPYCVHRDGGITTEDGTYFPPPLDNDKDYAAYLKEVNRRNR